MHAVNKPFMRFYQPVRWIVWFSSSSILYLFFFSLFSLLSLFWKNREAYEIKLLSVCALPQNATKQRLGTHVSMAMNTHAKLELSDAVSSAQSALYQIVTINWKENRRFVLHSRSCCRFFPMSQDNSVGIAMGYELDDRGSIPGRRKKDFFFCSPQRLDRLLVQLILYPMGNGGKAAGAWSWPLTSI
jgi:hypothetical protein